MKTLHVDDFNALNEEIRALSAAGMPLPDGLRGASAEYPGRVGRAAEGLAQRLEQGQSLDEALVEECGLHPTYATVVSAGLRSGRLTQAMEGVLDSSRRVASLRRLMIVSLAYPIFLLVLSYGLFIYLLGDRELFVDDLYLAFGLGPSPFAFYATLHETMWVWVWIPPAAFLICLIWILWAAGRGGVTSKFQLPVVRRLISDGRVASFLELLRMLIEAETPLDEACELAGNASADDAIQRSGVELAEKLRAGARSASAAGPIPPMIQWLILSGAETEALTANLRRSAQSYSRRVERMTAWMSVYIPLFFSFLIGGGATILFGLFVLGPWFHFLVRLGVSV